MIHHHKYGHDELMGMISWERLVFVALTAQYIKEEQERLKLQQQARLR